MPISQGFGHSFYDRISDLDEVMDFVGNDICAFIFFVLFSEAKKFRDGIGPECSKDSRFGLVTEVIFEVCHKRCGPCSFDLSGFRSKADKIRRLHFHHF